jgi:TolB-like protein/Tfp pilus assembly protein PilF
MAAADPARLLALAEAVADGSAIDWATASDSFAAPDRELVAELRLLAGVGLVHRAESSEAGAVAPADPPVLPVPQWGGLEIRGRVGAGQFGTVYRAWDTRLDREVAVKLLDRTTHDAGWTPGTLQEGRLLARVRHPHVVAVYGADEIDGRVGLWMELVRGQTLEAVFHQHGAFSASEAAVIGADLCSALAAVHLQGLVHRDVKAQNVMRESGGRIVLMDFGAGEAVASRARDGRMIGTPVYMAPELFAGQAATPQSDIYSVGVLLFWLVSGLYPVPGSTSTEIRAAAGQGGQRRRLRDERPELPTGFVAVVERALALNPRDRFATAGELEDALRQFVSTRSTTATGTGSSTARLTWARGWRAWIFAAVVALAAGSTWWMWRARDPVAGGRLPGVRSVQVLPFVNVSGDAANDYFATALADLIVSRLGSLKALRVSAGRPAAAARTASVDLAPSSEAILTGSVDRQGSQLRINVRLLQAGSDTIIWSESYERPVSEAFALQGLIARDLAREFRVSLSDDERTRLNQTYRPIPEAQDAFLRARALMHRQERASLQEARQLLEHAIATDPGYQLAYAAAARCYISLQLAGVLTPADSASLAREAAQKALALDDNADAELALAHVLFIFDRNWSGAETAYTRALTLNPSFSEARSRYSRFLAAAGRTQEAIEQASLGLQVDPLSMEMREALSMALYYDKQYRRALDTVAVPASIGTPSPIILARIHSALGDQALALSYIRDAYARSNSPAYLAEEGRIEAVAGNRARAEAVVAELRRQREAGAGYLFPGDIAFVLAALGATSEAIDWLEMAVADGSDRVLWLRVDPRVDALRSEPRFQALLRRIGP